MPPRAPSRHARIAAVLTWVYAAAFGVPTVPVAIYLLRRGSLPEFLGLFEMYGGPWSSTYGETTVVWLLIAFLFVTSFAAWAAWRLWAGSKTGGVLTLVVLPFEAAFWIGFALPFPWLIGVARAALVLSAWRSLRPRARVA